MSDGGEGDEEGTASQGEGGGEGGGAGDGVEALGAGALGPVLLEGGVRGWDGSQEGGAASREAARRAEELEEGRQLAAKVMEERKEEADKRPDEPIERRGFAQGGYREPAVEDAQYLYRRATEEVLSEAKLLRKMKRNLKNGPDSASPSARENVWGQEKKLEDKVLMRDKRSTELVKLVVYDALVQLEMAAQGKATSEPVPVLENLLRIMRSRLEEWDQCDAARAAMGQATPEEGQTGGRALPADQVAYGVGVEAEKCGGGLGGGAKRRPTSDETHEKAALRRAGKEEKKKEKSREDREEADALSAQGPAQKLWLNVFVSGARVEGEFGVVVVQSADEEDPLLRDEGEFLWKSGGKGGGRLHRLSGDGPDLSGILRAIRVALRWQKEREEWLNVQMRFFVPREARLLIQCFDECVPDPSNFRKTLKGGKRIKDHLSFWQKARVRVTDAMGEMCEEVFTMIKSLHLVAIFHEDRHGGGMMGASQFMRDANGEAFTRGGNKFTPEEIADKKRRASQKANSEKPGRPRRGGKKKAGGSSEEEDSEYGGNSEEDQQCRENHMGGSSEEESIEEDSSDEDDDDDEEGGCAGSDYDCDDFGEE